VRPRHTFRGALRFWYPSDAGTQLPVRQIEGTTFKGCLHLQAYEGENEAGERDREAVGPSAEANGGTTPPE